VIALGFEPGAFSRPLEGFGFLVPRRERRRLVACTFMGTKFPFRAAENRILLRCFLSGAPGSSMLDSYLSSVLDELRETIGLTGTPVFSRVYQWPLSMAQYTVGHQKRVAAIEEKLASNLGLYLAGNAYYGIGVPDCVRMARQFAERLQIKLL
jgi:oxygen-dependent protoporphyrinogen oxidase